MESRWATTRVGRTMSRLFSLGNSTSCSTMARRRPSVATVVSLPSRKLRRTLLRMGRESSVEAAYEVLRRMSANASRSSV